MTRGILLMENPTIKEEKMFSKNEVIGFQYQSVELLKNIEESRNLAATLMKTKHYQPFDWMMASLDGIDIDGQAILEIKCPGPSDHELAKAGKIPEKYIPQLQHQLAVTGLKLAYYFSFDGTDGVIVEIERDEIFIAKIIETAHIADAIPYIDEETWFLVDLDNTMFESKQALGHANWFYDEILFLSLLRCQEAQCLIHYLLIYPKMLHLHTLQMDCQWMAVIKHIQKVLLLDCGVHQLIFLNG